MNSADENERIYRSYQLRQGETTMRVLPGKIEIVPAPRPEVEPKTFIRENFIECPTCRAKPGMPSLCVECLERLEMFAILEKRGLLPKR